MGAKGNSFKRLASRLSVSEVPQSSRKLYQRCTNKKCRANGKLMIANDLIDYEDQLSDDEEVVAAAILASSVKKERVHKKIWKKIELDPDTLLIRKNEREMLEKQKNQDLIHDEVSEMFNECVESEACPGQKCHNGYFNDENPFENYGLN